MNNFALNIQILRKSNGFKQSDFEIIKIKRTTWNNYESGKSEPDIDTILRIANFFGVDLETLLVEDLSKNEHLISKIDTLKKPITNAENDSKPNMAMEDKTQYYTENAKNMQQVIDTQKQLIDSLNTNIHFLQSRVQQLEK
ncbi:helix-turn-helix domain-containing protein [Cytophaga aurantiaca]|uniref:helix-turn-helix domain-containing protein n=1 Tax=Cytophaga aurantiaca TaxID=29530 RepID=UPI000369E430|nr:helix-turn-helix transcriptional regulator [Cytophaga aurantiaca]